MKILVVHDHLRSGGTERQSVLLANAFAAAGHATTLLTFRPGGALARTVSPAVARKILQPFDTTLDWFAPGLVPFVEQLQPDVILCMGRMANCYGETLHNVVADRRPHTAIVATLRTGKSLPWLFRRSLRRARAIVANSHDARAVLVRAHGVPPDKIAVIHNSLVFPAISADSAAASRAALRAQHHASPATLVLLCVAMFRPEKKQRELIEIAAGLPPHLDWQLWLAGDGPARVECEHLAASRQLGGRVKFPGFVNDPSTLYAAADVAVHASASESLSNFFIEAQAHGLPCVAYDAQGIAETFVPGRTGWVIPRDDHTAFRAAIERLAASPGPERAARSAEARAFARATFDPARQVAAYLDLFARLTQVA